MCSIFSCSILRLQGCAIIYNMFANACLHKKPVPEIHSCILNMVIDFVNIMIIHFRNIHTTVPQLPQSMHLNIIHFVENNSYLNLVLSQDENPWNYKMYYLILILCVHIIFFFWAICFWEFEKPHKNVQS